jgi:flagellin-like protein
MKQVINKEDKAVSPIIATILLIAITVVLAATLVTILGGFTHGAGNTVEAAGVVTTMSSNGTITAKVSSSSQVLTNSQITYTLTLNGTFVYTGLLSNSYDDNVTNGAVVYIEQSSNSFTGGTVYTFYVHQSANAKSGTTISEYELTLNYKGTQFYSSGLQTSTS